MPHAVAGFGPGILTPADRAFGELGIARRVALQVHGFLPLPFVIAGTDMVAVVPEKLARMHVRDDGPLVVVEPPFGEVVLAEGYWFGRDRLSDPAHRWLFARFDELAEELARDRGADRRPRRSRRPSSETSTPTIFTRSSGVSLGQWNTRRVTSVVAGEDRAVPAVARPERLVLLRPGTEDVAARGAGDAHGVALLAEARPEHEERAGGRADQAGTVGEERVLGEVELLGRLDARREPQRLAPRGGRRGEEQHGLADWRGEVGASLRAYISPSAMPGAPPGTPSAPRL